MEVARGGVQGELSNTPVSVFGIRTKGRYAQTSAVNPGFFNIGHQKKLKLKPKTQGKTQPQGGTYLILKNPRKITRFYQIFS